MGTAPASPQTPRPHPSAERSLEAKAGPYLAAALHQSALSPHPLSSLSQLALSPRPLTSPSQLAQTRVDSAACVCLSCQYIYLCFHVRMSDESHWLSNPGLSLTLID